MGILKVKHWEKQMGLQTGKLMLKEILMLMETDLG